MTPREINEARHNFGLGRKDFARLILGSGGDPRNAWLTVKRWENGERVPPENIGRLIQMLLWFKEDHGFLPDLDAGTRGPLRIPEKWEMSDG